MKSNFTRFLQQSFRALVPVMTVVCLSVGAETMQQDMNNAPAAAPAESAEIVSAGQGETSAVTEEVESLRTAEIQKITEMLSKAAKHSEQNEFKEAFSLYLQSEKTLDTLPDTSYTRPLRKKIESMRQLSQSKYADILLQSYMDEYMTKIDKGTHNRKPDQTAFENAKILFEKLDEVLGVYYLGVLPGNDINNAALDRARAKSPKFAEEIDGYKNKCTKVVDAYNFFAETSLQAVDPNADKRNADIQSLLAKGKAYFRANDFGKAKETYEQVFIYDPFNAEANEQLQKIYKKMNFYAEQRAYSEMLKISAQTEWAFSLGLQNDERVNPTRVNMVRDEASVSLQNKLESLKFETITFEDTEIETVITYLKNESKKIDPDGEGVNFVVKVSPQVKKDDIKVNLSLLNISMSDVLRYVCQTTGLQYRIQDNTVLIGTHDLEDLETQFLKVHSYLISRVANSSFSSGMSSSFGESGDEGMGGGGMPMMMGGAHDPDAASGSSSGSSGRMSGSGITRRSSSSSDDGGSSSGLKGLGGSKEGSGSGDFTADGAFDSVDFENMFGDVMDLEIKTVSSADLKQYFSDRGVSFDVPGSSIAYDPRATKLTVRNTHENIRKLESLLRELDIENPQVLVESKIMEVSVEDEQEFGFDWVLTHDSSDNPQWNFQIDTSSILRQDTASANQLINNMNILPNFGKDGAWNLSFSVNAVDRIGRTEVLATPRVHAPSGQMAMVQMVREMYFPDSWTDPEVETDCGNSFKLKPSYPEFGDAVNVGIQLQVLPSVSPNNYTIKLSIMPSVTDLTGWSDYGYNLIVANTSNLTALKNLASEGEKHKITMKMPEIARREVETNVKVYDGQSVVIGGMINEVGGEVDDRLPFLGDLPLIGRLFHSVYSKNEKNNLLISVTPRLVTGDGLPVRSNPVNGLPEFKR